MAPSPSDSFEELWSHTFVRDDGDARDTQSQPTLRSPPRVVQNQHSPPRLRGSSTWCQVMRGHATLQQQLQQQKHVNRLCHDRCAFAGRLNLTIKFVCFCVFLRHFRQRTNAIGQRKYRAAPLTLRTTHYLRAHTDTGSRNPSITQVTQLDPMDQLTPVSHSTCGTGLVIQPCLSVLTRVTLSKVSSATWIPTSKHAFPAQLFKARCA